MGTAGSLPGDALHPAATGARSMVDREKVLAVLRRRFPTASDRDIAAAANAIVGLEDEWHEVECTDVRDLLDRIRSGYEFRLLERMSAR